MWTVYDKAQIVTLINLDYCVLKLVLINKVLVYCICLTYHRDCAELVLDLRCCLQ